MIVPHKIGLSQLLEDKTTVKILGFVRIIKQRDSHIHVHVILNHKRAAGNETHKDILMSKTIRTRNSGGFGRF